MRLDGEQRERAIKLFQQGAEAGFELQQAIDAFVATCGHQKQLQQTLLLFLISLANADQVMEPSEHAALVSIAGKMGFSVTQLEQLLRMARAQEQFHQQGATSSASSLQDAYAALGVDSSVSDKELKREYRRRMSENHPDKLIAKGVPEDMIKLATTRSQEIQAAYEAIKKSRQ